MSPRTVVVTDRIFLSAMARDVIAHDVDLPSLEYDDEETSYMATETPSFDPDDASLGSTFVILDEDPVSDPEDDDDDIAPLVTGGVNRTLASAVDLSSSNSSAGGKTKLLDRIKEHKSYQKLARIVKKKGPISSVFAWGLEWFREVTMVRFRHGLFDSVRANNDVFAAVRSWPP